MESVAETRDRLNRIRDTGSADANPNPKPPSRKCPHGRLYQKCELCDRDRKIESLDRLCRRQSVILTGVAVALRGEPEDMTAWSHHDLAERVQATIEELERLREAFQDQAERLAELEVQRCADEQVRENTDGGALVLTEDATERSGPIDAVSWEEQGRQRTAYVPTSQAQLVVLAERLERFRARVRSVANTRTGSPSLPERQRDSRF